MSAAGGGVHGGQHGERAPYRITDEDVAAWLAPPFTDHGLVHLTAFGATCAVGRVEATLTTGTKERA